MAITLASLAKNQTKPPRVIVYGDAGIGKTTFAASAPNPVFIQTEDGLGDLDAVAFPLAKSYDEVLEALGSLYVEDHDFRTVVIDSLDWLEPLVWDKTCETLKIASIEAAGFGKGYVEALKWWRRFFEAVTSLRDARGMTAIMIAHSQVVRVEDPMQPAYDTHDLKLHKRASAVASEFSDVILFAAQKTLTTTEEVGFNQKRTRAITTGARVVHTQGSPAFTAKNRYRLPSELPLSWEAFAQAMAQ